MSRRTPAIPCRIFLDDERMPPPGEWLVARTEPQFRALLCDHVPTIISFDHDLGSDECGAERPNGQHCMHALVEAAMDRPDWFADLDLVVLHSANPVGRANMRGLLESAQRHGILPRARIVELPVTSHPLAAWQIE